MRSDIIPGGVFPDYALPDHTSTVRTLSELQGRDPMILTLARGNYCPKEHHQHLELAANYPKIAVAYTQVVTISTDEHHTLQEFRASVGAQWTFLSDPGRTIQKDLDIAEYTDPENDPMIPYTLVLKPGLVIHSVYNGYWFWGRPAFYDLWRDLRAATSEIRQDWDLGTPGLREAWAAGDYSKFHGWDQRSGKLSIRERAARRDDSVSGEASRAQNDVMEMAGVDVLLDPAFTVPAVPEAAAGVGWIRCMVPRFCEGDAHAQRRALVERVIAQMGRPRRSYSPTATLLDAMGLAPGLEPDVAAVSLAYQPGSLVPPEADAAADRLVAACGGRTEESAARVCVLAQAHVATLALIARLEAGDGEPPVPATRRITPDGHEILVDLATAPFGAGRHACPGQALALHLADAPHQ